MQTLTSRAVLVRSSAANASVILSGCVDFVLLDLQKVSYFREAM